MNMEQLVNLAFLAVLERELYKDIKRTERELTESQKIDRYLIEVKKWEEINK